jgi:hypothetical protein
MEMSPLPFVAAACALAACFAAGSAAATTALEGRVFQQSQTQVDDVGPFKTVRQDSWVDVPKDMFVSAASQSFREDDTVLTSDALAAHWNSADSGSVQVNDHGWTMFSGDPDVHLLSTNLVGDLPDWSYLFTAEGRTAFKLNFDLLATGESAIGLGAWDLSISQDGGPEEITHLNLGLTPGVDATGTFARLLQAGSDYRVSLRNLEGRTIQGVTNDPDIRIDHETGVFNWSISNAPEPSSWVLSILGLGLMGAALRRAAQRAAV